MRKLMFAFISIFCALFLNTHSFAGAVQEGTELTVSVSNNILTVHAVRMNSREVLREVERKAAIRLTVVEGVPDHNVTFEIKSLPLFAIGQLFEKMDLKNYAVFYDKDVLTAVIVPEGRDLAEFSRGKSVIRVGDFRKARAISRVKGKDVVTKEDGGYRIPVSYVKNEMLLKFHRGVSDDEKEDLFRRYGLVDISGDGLSKIGFIKVSVPEDKDVVSLAQEFRKENKLKAPEPNYVANILAVEDPLYAAQWYVPETKFGEAWDSAKSTTQIKVAIIDSGVNAGHPDLKGRVLAGFNFVGNNSKTEDENGHGTFVTGIIAAAANKTGIKGLFDFADIIPVKVTDENGLGTYEDAAKGIIYAADNGARVINLSIGGYGYSVMLQEAVDYALEKGCIVVAAGGNDGVEQAIYPAGYPDVIGVAALGRDGQVWSGSNRGRHIDVSAPGEDIISTGLGEDYAYASGTSASAPMVSALAAMIISERPELSRAAIERLISQSAKDLGEKGRDNVYGYGLINAAAALERKVKPFNDVAVMSVLIEPMVFEKGSPAFIVTEIKNQGSYASERTDIILFSILGDKEVEIGSKENISVANRATVAFEWTPSPAGEQVEFRVEAVSAGDSFPDNNSRKSKVFSVEERADMHGLYWTQVGDTGYGGPTHQWIALQAFNKLPSSSLKTEMSGYLPTSSLSVEYSKDYVLETICDSNGCTDVKKYIFVPSEWRSDLNSYSPSMPGTALIEGAWEEDQGTRGDHYKYCDHYWDADLGYNAGYDSFCFLSGGSLFLPWDGWDSTLKVIQEESFPNAVSSYLTGQKPAAYYWLGRAAHLLADMTLPAHVLRDGHVWDRYEDHCGDYYSDITSLSPNTNIPVIANLPAYPRTDIPGGYVYVDDLTKLMYNLAQRANDFDSDDYNGRSFEHGYGIYRYAKNDLAAGKTVARVEYWYDWPWPMSNEYIRDLVPGFDYKISTNACEHRIYYYETLYNDMNNTLYYPKVIYTDGTSQDFTNLDENTLNDVWPEPVKCIYQPELQAKATGYVAALYQLFWSKTHATLTVSKSGTGSGQVTSTNISGIICGKDCSQEYVLNQPVTLSATAAAGSTFSGWSGSGCSGTGNCNVTMSAARNVTAAFDYAVKGDVNIDGSVNIVDALLVARYAAGLSVSNFNVSSADVNCDFKINIVDALLIARKTAGLAVADWCQ